MELIERIKQKLTAAFSPEKLEIIDHSEQHAGHRGSSGGAHMVVMLVSDAFDGQSEVARQRKVFSVLADEMKHDIHALSIDAKTPGEYNEKN